MNLCSRHSFCPQKGYNRTLFLFGAIYEYTFRSHLHHSVTTHILNCKVSRLARMTSHMTLSDTTNYYSSRPHRFQRKYKNIIYIYIYIYMGGPGSSGSITTDYGLEGQGSNPGRDEIFRPSRPALGPTQPPVKWVQGHSLGLNAAGACC